MIARGVVDYLAVLPDAEEKMRDDTHRRVECLQAIDVNVEQSVASPANASTPTATPGFYAAWPSRQALA